MASDDDDEVIVYLTKGEIRALIQADDLAQRWKKAAAPSARLSAEVALMRSAAQKFREALEESE